MAEIALVKAPARTERRRSRLRAFLDRRWPALAAVIGLLALWELITAGFHVPSYMAPSPVEVLAAFRDEGQTLWNNFWPTLLEALLGFFFGNTAAVLVAVLFVYSQTAERAFYPVAVFMHTIPIIAIAPILVLLFGNGYTPKIIIAAMICFFPTLVNMVRGLKAVSPAALELMQVLSATKAEIFWKLRLQSSLPFLFAALKIAATTCVIGAIVGEWIGSSFGLGALIIEATYNFRSSLLYATVFVAALLAVLLFSAVSLLEARIIRWKSPAVS